MDVTHYQTPFPHSVIDDFIGPDGLVGTDKMLPLAAHADVTEAGDGAEWSRYDNPHERKRATRDFAGLGASARELAELLTDRQTAFALGQLTNVDAPLGIEADPSWHGGGYHVTEAGGHLGPHLDYALHPVTGMERRVNLVLFLTPAWQEAWGGRLQFWNDDVTEVQSSVLPRYNRAVIWCPGDLTYHSVEAVPRWLTCIVCGKTFGSDRELSSRACKACWPDMMDGNYTAEQEAEWKRTRVPRPRVTLACYYVAAPRPGACRKVALFRPNRGAA